MQYALELRIRSKLELRIHNRDFYKCQWKQAISSDSKSMGLERRRMREVMARGR